MPMVIESIVAILACARIGATHVVVFGGFSAHELANRIVDSNPKAIILSNAGKEPNKVLNYKQIVNQSLELAHKKELPKIILQRTNLLHAEPLQANEFDFLQVEQAGDKSSPIFVNSDHPLYILYTSGTTGKPKGIVRDHGGTAVLLQHAMRRIYNIKPGNSMFCSSDIGWVLGHSFIIYGPLIAGIKSVLFEGKPVGTPNPDVFW